MKQRIFVSVFNNLYTDQRVEKTCLSIHNNGFLVHLIGNTWGGSPPINRPYQNSRIQINSSLLKFAYIEHQIKLLWYLFRNRENIDLLWVNDVDTVLPNIIISKLFNRPLIIDFHEIYSEMPSVKNRKIRHVWKWIEKYACRNCKHFVTINESYRNWYKSEYGIDSQIVRNVPFYIPEFENPTPHAKKNIIYQGTLNFSRGIECMIQAMKFLPNCIFQVVGDGPMRENFKQLVDKLDLKESVVFLGKKSPNELREITKNADLGISIEENNGLSYYYSLPNKVSDYIQAQVPVLCADFPEMRKVIETYKVGELLDDYSGLSIANKVKKILENSRDFYKENLLIAKKDLCWDNDEEILLECVKKSLSDK